jgi:hypothetical protein
MSNAAVIMAFVLSSAVVCVKLIRVLAEDMPRADRIGHFGGAVVHAFIAVGLSQILWPWL